MIRIQLPGFQMECHQNILGAVLPVPTSPLFHMPRLLLLAHTIMALGDGSSARQCRGCASISGFGVRKITLILDTRPILPYFIISEIEPKFYLLKAIQMKENRS